MSLQNVGSTLQAPCILSLFDHSGVWSAPYREAGYRVVRVDLADGRDVRSIETFIDRPRAWLRSLAPVHGVIMAPPCTEFAGSGARWWAEKDAQHPERLRDAMRLFGKAMAIVWNVKPAWFVIENPIGRAGRLLLGEPAFRYDPHEFAGWADDPASEAYTKRTCLWGAGWRRPTPKPVPPVLGSKMHRMGESKARAAARSLTPTGFARAWFEANP